MVKIKDKKDLEVRNMIYDLIDEMGMGDDGKDILTLNHNNHPISFSFQEIKKIIIKNNLSKKEIKEVIIKNFERIKDEIDLKLEKEKIKREEQKAKIRERAEREYYGKVKTKRQAFNKDLKEAVYHKYNNECALCGAKEGLHIHHRNQDAKNNQLSNLILLCGVCHKKMHMNVR
jgi:hypothetical protein